MDATTTGQEKPLHSNVSSVFILPEERLNPERHVLLNQAAEIVSEEFTQDLIDHRRVGLAHNGIPELPLHRTERGFNISALVIMGQKLLTLELEEVEHLLKESIHPASRVRPERHCSSRNFVARAFSIAKPGRRAP